MADIAEAARAGNLVGFRGGPEMVVALLGILRQAGLYPSDRVSEQRLELMLADCAGECGTQIVAETLPLVQRIMVGRDLG